MQQVEDPECQCYHTLQLQCDTDVKHSKPSGHDGMKTGLKPAKLVHTATQRVTVLQTRQLHKY